MTLDLQRRDINIWILGGPYSQTFFDRLPIKSVRNLLELAQGLTNDFTHLGSIVLHISTLQLGVLSRDIRVT